MAVKILLSEVISVYYLCLFVKTDFKNMKIFINMLCMGFIRIDLCILILSVYYSIYYYHLF